MAPGIDQERKEVATVGIMDTIRGLLGQAKEKAEPLVEQAKEKVEPIVEKAKEKAEPLVEKVKGESDDSSKGGSGSS